MNMIAGSQPQNRTMVAIAEAARLLTAAGDPIDASNVSRYVARHKIPSEKRGRERLVDLQALIAHRGTSVFVSDKQSQRGIEPIPTPAPVISPPTERDSGAEDADGDDLDAGSTMSQLNRALKQLELRRRQREEDLADGTVIAAEEVQAMLSGVMLAFIASLERAEGDIAQRFGREISGAFRKARKSAQMEAATRIADLAKKHLPPSLGGTLETPAPPEESADI